MLSQYNLPVIDLALTGKNIKNLRETSRLEVRDIQEILGISLQAIYRWERGETLPSVDNLVILSKIFNTTINGILILEESQDPVVFWGRLLLNHRFNDNRQLICHNN